MTCKVEIDGVEIPCEKEGKCLGIGGRGICLQRGECDEGYTRSFFMYGALGAFQGDLSPLSTRSVIETCVVPVLLYGCEH